MINPVYISPVYVAETPSSTFKFYAPHSIKSKSNAVLLDANCVVVEAVLILLKIPYDFIVCHESSFSPTGIPKFDLLKGNCHAF